MAWTYDSTLSTDRDKIRVLIGDYDSNDPMLSDEEIAFMQAENGDIYSTAAACIDIAIAALARKPESKSVGPLSLSYAGRIRNLEAARTRIKKMKDDRAGVPIPYAGGISRDDKIAVEQAGDRTNDFAIGQMDAPGGMNGDDLTDITDRDHGGW